VQSGDGAAGVPTTGPSQKPASSSAGSWASLRVGGSHFDFSWRLVMVIPDRVTATHIHDRTAGVSQFSSDSIEADVVIDHPIVAGGFLQRHAIADVAADQIGRLRLGVAN
jgi:hypothetical protein